MEDLWRQGVLPSSRTGLANAPAAVATHTPTMGGSSMQTSLCLAKQHPNKRCHAPQGLMVLVHGMRWMHTLCSAVDACALAQPCKPSALHRRPLCPWSGQDKEGDDPSRVGAATNPLMGNGGLSTSIAKMPGGARSRRTRHRTQHSCAGASCELGMRAACLAAVLMYACCPQSAVCFSPHATCRHASPVIIQGRQLCESSVTPSSLQQARTRAGVCPPHRPALVCPACRVLSIHLLAVCLTPSWPPTRAVGGSQYNMLMKLHNRQTGSDRQMQAANKEINRICESLRLPDIVKNSALEVFKDVSEGVCHAGGQRHACALRQIEPGLPGALAPATAHALCPLCWRRRFWPSTRVLLLLHSCVEPLLRRPCSCCWRCPYCVCLAVGVCRLLLP